ncbi:chemotaxis-specific protein-glutamate methyltransferase CheB [Reichenbachiella agarivorans]|uniref:Protein-glutamate methylesterase/protein-glutamine glutaminase n=1 Tax=Reichenbachiella agarivorans TaxID=2979464 RepID=A0ABY6CKR2_9BACT|nr:chemotaxis-specific protein-glutamate methyltransferase CheB [Reichenbachiella agarivorans]UXP31096.1 chemotaxis-specific protein-glutamate methyltransferase CheB [Reichenbachiella agarivorans]
MDKVRVVVADDSGFMRLLISDILTENGSVEVIGTAVDGKDAAIKVAELRPDVLLLDMNMGEYDGLYAVKRIMSENPLPILILSSIGNTNLQPIFDALDLGAVDYLNKPEKGNSKLRNIEVELIQKIKNAKRANTKAIPDPKINANTYEHTFNEKSKYDVIVIGASTGGPSAIEKVINSLPGNLNVPVLICQHMPPNFIGSFVKRLNAMSPLQIEVGRENMRPKAGHIIVAPGESNMVVTKKRSGGVYIGFTDQVFPEYNCPSINALMLSVAEVYKDRSIGVVLTGMGKDGMLGMKQIKEQGGYTIAQSEKSCVIYGMPKAAVEYQAVDRSIDINEIGGFLVNSL